MVDILMKLNSRKITIRCTATQKNILFVLLVPLYSAPETDRHIRQVSLDSMQSKCIMPLPLQVNWSDHAWPWPLTLKIFSAMATHMMNICGKFH